MNIDIELKVRRPGYCWDFVTNGYIHRGAVNSIDLPTLIEKSIADAKRYYKTNDVELSTIYITGLTQAKIRGN